MSKTDELRALLDERGVAHRDFKNATTWIGVHSETVIAYIVKSGELLVKHVLTPEQAIAVTLGSAREAELRDALNEVADKWVKAQVEAGDLARENMLLKAKLEAATSGSGKLTAEFVEQAVRRNIAFCECDEEDVQAIADELNAALGSEESTDVDDVLAMVDEMHEDGTLDYGRYSMLHDAVSTLGSGTCEEYEEGENRRIYDDADW